jgi:hypothetical protein
LWSLGDAGASSYEGSFLAAPQKQPPNQPQQTKPTKLVKTKKLT